MMAAQPPSTAPLALVIDQFGYLGGGQVVLMEVVSTLQSSGFRVKVIAPKGGELENQISSRFGGKVEMLDQPPSELTDGKKTLRDVFRLFAESARFVRRWRSQARSASVIYANGSRWFLAAAILSRLTRAPVVLHLHLRYGILEKILITFSTLLARNPLIIANSDYTARSAGKFLSFWQKKARVHVIENCLPISHQALEYRPGVNDNREKFECVVVGLLCANKGQDIAVNALKDIPAVNIHLVGRINASGKEWATSLLKNKPANVIYHGETADVLGLINKEDIFVNIVPSRRDESFGLVAIEGMADSCITIVSQRGALPTIAKRTGALVFDGTEQGLRAVVLDLIARNRGQLEELRRSQYEKTKAEYSRNRFQKELGLLLQSTLNRDLRPALVVGSTNLRELV